MTRSRFFMAVGFTAILFTLCAADEDQHVPLEGQSNFRDYLALPVFLLKVFRHKSIFIHADRGITGPKDLRGRRVATVGYSSIRAFSPSGLLRGDETAPSNGRA